MKNLLILITIIVSQITYSQNNEGSEKTIESDVDMAKFYYEKGIDKIETEDYNGALEDFDNAIKLSSKDSE
jgi:outer membrane protein assembly factor BamD (BamD/ComL family)